MKPSLKFMVIPLAIGALFFAGCGGDDSSDDDSASETPTTQTQPAENGADTGNANGGDTTAAAQTLDLAADPSGALAYETTELSAKPGKITINFTNDAPVAHDVVIDDPNGKELARTDVITGDTATTEFTADKPGDYKFYCSVPGHEAAGMVGTLKVQ